MGGHVQVGDTRLYVVERGHGYPLIVLHGGPGGDYAQFDEPLAGLRDEFRLILVDQRAQGRSDDAPRETWTVRQMAMDVCSLAKTLRLRDYAVLGHSFGALVALEHAVRWPGAAAQTIVSHGVPSLRFYRLPEELARCQPEVIAYGEELAARQRLSPIVNREMSKSGYGGFDVEDDLTKVTQPVLVLTGRHERTCPVEAAT